MDWPHFYSMITLNEEVITLELQHTLDAKIVCLFYLGCTIWCIIGIIRNPMTSVLVHYSAMWSLKELYEHQIQSNYKNQPHTPNSNLFHQLNFCSWKKIQLKNQILRETHQIYLQLCPHLKSSWLEYLFGERDIISLFNYCTNEP